MSIYDFIRGIFGLPTRRKNNENWFKKPTIGDNDDDDDDDDEYDDDTIIFDENRHGGPFGFNVFSGNMNDIHRYFQLQMNDMIKNFESPWFNTPADNYFGAIDNGDSGTNPETKVAESPRNKFLKPPNEQQKNDAWTQSENESQAVQIPEDRNHGFGNFFSSDPLEFHKFFEQQIDDIMKRFSFSTFFHFDEGDTFGLPEENPGRVEEFIHPRNKFFKPSYEQPQGFKPDSDIDNESYAPKVFGKLLDKEPVQSPTSSFISRSMVTSHQRKILPNGGIEERRKSIKDGKEEVIVSRKIGDRKHVVTTIKMPDGSTTKNEEFINFDEGQLGEFYKIWNKM